MHDKLKYYYNAMCVSLTSSNTLRSIIAYYTVDSYQQVLEMLRWIKRNPEQDAADIVKSFTASHPATPNARRRVPRRLSGYEENRPHQQ